MGQSKYRLTIQVGAADRPASAESSGWGQLGTNTLSPAAGWAVPGGLPAAGGLHLAAVPAPTPVWQARGAANLHSAGGSTEVKARHSRLVRSAQHHSSSKSSSCGTDPVYLYQQGLAGNRMHMCVLHTPQATSVAPSTLSFLPQGVPLPAVAAWQPGPDSRSCPGSTLLPGLAAVGRSGMGCCAPPGVCRGVGDLLQLQEPGGPFC